MKKKKVPVEELPRVPESHSVVLMRGHWHLFKKGKKKSSYVCGAASENGAHRESLLFLAGKL